MPYTKTTFYPSLSLHSLFYVWCTAASATTCGDMLHTTLLPPFALRPISSCSFRHTRNLEDPRIADSFWLWRPTADVIQPIGIIV